MKTLERHLLSLWDPPFELPSNLARCDWRSILLKVEEVDDRPTLCKGLFNPYLLGETHLHDDANVESLNRVLQKGVMIIKQAKNHI
jgi:hypothetical protein